MIVRSNRLPLLFSALFSLIYSSNNIADDIELYRNQINLPPEQVRPNVVFVLDSSISMRRPVQQYGSKYGQEHKHYQSNIRYSGFRNSQGGAGDQHFYYLYSHSSNHYVYHNKVHRTQMGCTLSELDSRDPFSNEPDKFIFRSYPHWIGLCAEYDTRCQFKAAANGPKVDCKQEQVYNAPSRYYHRARPNLYVFDANTHNFLQSYYRNTVMQRVMKDIIDKPFDINMALMKFNNHRARPYPANTPGGRVIKEAVNATDSHNQTLLKSTIDSLVFNSYTPLTESLWEASKYLRGESAEFGRYPKSVRPAFERGNTYNSPIDYACQKSHIILLTDGEPTLDNEKDAAIKRLTKTRCRHTHRATTANQSCLDDYAEWLHTDNSKLSKRRDHSALLGGEQQIAVHTVGFGLDNPLLAATARKGGGLNKVASTADELAEAFSTILEQAEFEKDTFVAPAIAVNTYNGLQHRNELYFALFQPQATPRWPGNIKKYTLSGNTIIDRNNKSAIDARTGFFKPESLSHWTTSQDLDDGDPSTKDPVGDGGIVELGGIASQLTSPATRTIYTYTGNATPNNAALTDQLTTSNRAITTQMLAVENSTHPAQQRRQILNWARGYTNGDNSKAANHFVGDFLHNRPALVTYQTFKPTREGGRPRFDDTLFAGSNLGFFHAIDPNNGSELFSFIPKILLPNLTHYYKNTGGFDDKVYGLDAPMTVWRYDEDGDGNIVNGTAVDGNDHVFIYQAMRRGGSSIYALDVTRRNQPKLKWRIDGQAYANTPSGAFRDLAQTWSVPQLGKIQWGCNSGNCTDKYVLFFGGGYDVAHDNGANTVRRSKGNAVYMVDAETGNLLWSAGAGRHHTNNVPTMNHSIAANVTIGDVDNDGYIDFLFAVDVRGGLWRFDFAGDHSKTAHTQRPYRFATGGKIAYLGGNTAHPRRFYNAPDVAYFAQRGKKPFLTIAVSSGYRAHPRDTSINDFLFVVYDKNARSKPKDNNYHYVRGSRHIRFSDLSHRGTEYGWYKPLIADGEKGLSRTVTFNDKIIMTTYVPGISSSCEGSTGSGRYYMLDALSGESLLKNSNGDIVPYQNLQNSGIPAEPAVIFSTEKICIEHCDDNSQAILEDKPNLVVCVGTECIDDVLEQKLHKTFWREN